MSHHAKTSKDRTSLFGDEIFQLTEDTGKTLREWLMKGGAPAPEPDPIPAPVTATATQATATPAAPAANRATTPRAQSVAQPVAQGAKAPTPTKAGASAAASPSPAKTQSADAAGASSAVPELPPEFVAAMAELAEVTVGMPDKTRAALIADFEREGPDSLPALLEEIAKTRFIMCPETIPTTAGEAIAQLPRIENAPISQATADFVDGLADGPEEHPTDGCISAVQYEALNTFVGAFGINRDALRSYMAKAGHLLPGKNGPTLARMKAEEFAKLRTKLTNNAIAAKGETWSARTVRLINATPITTYQPVAAAS